MIAYLIAYFLLYFQIISHSAELSCFIFPLISWCIFEMFSLFVTLTNAVSNTVLAYIYYMAYVLIALKMDLFSHVLTGQHFNDVFNCFPKHHFTFPLIVQEGWNFSASLLKFIFSFLIFKIIISIIVYFFKFLVIF